MIETDTKNISKSKKKVTDGKENRFLHYWPTVILKLKSARFQQLLLKVVLVLAALILGLVILETGARVFEKKNYGIDSCQSLDENFHHVMIPNSACRFKASEWDIDYKINSLGLRGDEVNLEKEPGVFRILILGDSFMQGYGVDYNKSFGKVLEKELNAAKDSKKVEVISSGVFGYSPLTEYLYLKKKGLAFNPDLVLLAFGPTDFFEDRQRMAELRLSYPSLNEERIGDLIRNGEAKFRFDLINRSPNNVPQKILLPGVSYRAKTWLRDHLRTYRALVDFIKKKKAQATQQDILHKGDIEHDILAIERGNEISDLDWQKLWVLPTGHIVMTKELLSTKNVPFLVITIPDPMQISDSEWPGRKALGFPTHYIEERIPFEEELTKRLSGKNISSVNLLPEFKAEEGPFYFAYDGHWRESGHKLAGEVTAKYLEENPVYRDLFKSKPY